MENILIFGTGGRAEKVLKTVDEDSEIIGFIDNNEKKQGTLFHNKVVFSINEINNLTWDVIVICSVAYKAIVKQLLEIGIASEKIKSWEYFHRKRFLKEYNTQHYCNNIEIQKVVDYVKLKGLSVFNYPFKEKYEETCDIEVSYDRECDLYYVMYMGKKMYMKRSFTNKEEIKKYVCGILIEQDKKSPHCYLSPQFDVEKDDVVVDAGVAEGNFSLSIIERVKHIYMIESDDEWIEALHHSFAPYSDKVTIIKGFLCDKRDQLNCTLDDLFYHQKINFIKMDIEGAEPQALLGGQKLLDFCHPKLDICVYHNQDDELKVTKIIEKKNYVINLSEGYMVFFYDPQKMFNNELMPLVHGLIRAEWRK